MQTFLQLFCLESLYAYCLSVCLPNFKNGRLGYGEKNFMTWPGASSLASYSPSEQYGQIVVSVGEGDV